jgi:hypothetical protein
MHGLDTIQKMNQLAAVAKTRIATHKANCPKAYDYETNADQPVTPVTKAGAKVIRKLKKALEPVRMGPEIPVGQARMMQYCGPNPKLKGKHALVCRIAGHNNLVVCAQFNEVSTGCGFGWHRFRKDEFKKFTL